MKQAYRVKKFQAKTRRVIKLADEITAEYQRQNLTLTVRQLFYQFVARGLKENTEKAYDSLSRTMTDARDAGLIDWDAIEDRTRNLVALQHWASPQEIIAAIARSYLEDKWATQLNRVEVWCEKEALSGVFERICQRLDVPFFACRGNVSTTAIREAAQRLRDLELAGQQTFILYFGDHDPTGVDMLRDIRDRLGLYGSNVTVEHIALTIDQVKQYNPPPNFAKVTDSRAADYIKRFGDKSWELDALDPATLSALVEKNVLQHLDARKWAKAEFHEHEQRKSLVAVAAADWPALSAYAASLQGP